MQIIALASYLSTERGGLERSLFDVCQNLAQRGHQITLLYEDEGNQFEAYRQFCAQMIQVNRYKLNARFLSDLCKIPVPKSALVYSNQYDNFFFGAALSALHRVPFVCHLRLHASTENSRIKRIKQSLTLARINRYIAISEAVKQDWCGRLNISPEKVEVVYNGLDFEKFQIADDWVALRQQWQLPVEAKVISYVGRLEPDKGIETLLEAFALLVATGVPAHLLIAGKPLFAGAAYQASLVALAERLGIAHAVRFLGHLANPQSLYQVSDVNVLPSIWLEAFGRVVIESMACGTPALGSRVGGIPEVLTGEFSDWLFQPGDQYDLFHSLKSILDWRQTDPTLAQRCRQQVIQHFPIHRTIDGIETVLQNTLNL